MGAAQVDLARPVHQAAGHKGRAVVQVPVLTDRVDARLEKLSIKKIKIEIILLKQWGWLLSSQIY